MMIGFVRTARAYGHKTTLKKTVKNGSIATIAWLKCTLIVSQNSTYVCSDGVLNIDSGHMSEDDEYEFVCEMCYSNASETRLT